MERNNIIIWFVCSAFACTILGSLFMACYAKVFELIQHSANLQADYLKTADKFIYANYKETNGKVWLYTIACVFVAFALAISIIVFLFSLLILNQS